MRVKIYYYHGLLSRKIDPYLERNFHLISQFREHLRRLKGSRFLSLEELGEELRAPKRSGRPAVMLTFDDGYANNLDAAEILSRARIPWCLFVSTAAVGRKQTTWPVELSLLLLHGRAPRIETLGYTWPLGSEEERIIACEVIRRRMKVMPQRRRVKVMQEIRAHYEDDETERLLRGFPSMRSLSWQEIRQLSGSGVEIGSHGVLHETHHARQPVEVRRFELARSRDELAARLGKPCRSFAYPNGDHAPGSSALVKAAGYRFAFTTDPAAADASSDPFRLPRFEPESL